MSELHLTLTIDRILNTVRYPDTANPRVNIGRGMKADDAVNKLKTDGWTEVSRTTSPGILQIKYTRTIA